MITEHLVTLLFMGIIAVGGLLLTPVIALLLMLVLAIPGSIYSVFAARNRR